MNSSEALKVFGMTTQLIDQDLAAAEKTLGIDLARGLERPGTGIDEDYYPQIEQRFRVEAAAMAPHYETFYSLERTIRTLVADTLAAVDPTWWSSGRVPQKIRDDVAATRQREIDSGHTPRSEDDLDYTTFGELGQIITGNWDVFGSLFSSSRAVAKVMANLNTLRGPIAHCSPLAPDEVVRLQLSVRDWFRLQS
jgi:hypothetical protein